MKNSNSTMTNNLPYYSSVSNEFSKYSPTDYGINQYLNPEEIKALNYLSALEGTVENELHKAVLTLPHIPYPLFNYLKVIIENSRIDYSFLTQLVEELNINMKYYPIIKILAAINLCLRAQIITQENPDKVGTIEFILGDKMFYFYTTPSTDVQEAIKGAKSYLAAIKENRRIVTQRIQEIKQSATL